MVYPLVSNGSTMGVSIHVGHPYLWTPSYALSKNMFVQHILSIYIYMCVWRLYVLEYVFCLTNISKTNGLSQKGEVRQLWTSKYNSEPCMINQGNEGRLQAWDKPISCAYYIILSCLWENHTLSTSTRHAEIYLDVCGKQSQPQNVSLTSQNFSCVTSIRLGGLTFCCSNTLKFTCISHQNWHRYWYLMVNLISIFTSKLKLCVHVCSIFFSTSIKFTTILSTQLAVCQNPGT